MNPKHDQCTSHYNNKQFLIFLFCNLSIYLSYRDTKQQPCITHPDNRRWTYKKKICTQVWRICIIHQNVRVLCLCIFLRLVFFSFSPFFHFNVRASHVCLFDGYDLAWWKCFIWIYIYIYVCGTSPYYK